MATHDVIVIGASAGGVEALTALIADLPRDLRAAVLVVLHLSKGRSLLPEILTRAGRLHAVQGQDGAQLRYGRIYVAPPDHHLLVEGNRVRLGHGPTENGVRPAVDPLFRSAARAFGPRVVGVILTGSLDDGTAGLAAVKEAGGVAVVQDPEEAFAPSMPRSALQLVQVDHVLPLREIPALLASLAHEQTLEQGAATNGPLLAAMEPELAPQPLVVRPEDRPGDVSVFTCPECHGSLWEVDDEGILRFRCRVGHVYSSDSMMAAQADSVDRALWTALRSLEERAALLKRLADRSRRRGQAFVATAFDERALKAQDDAAVIRNLLHQRLSPVPDHASEDSVPDSSSTSTSERSVRSPSSE